MKQMAVCWQTLGALSSGTLLSVLVGALFKKFILFLNTPHICHVPRSTHSSWFDHPNNIWWGIVSINFLESRLLHPLIFLSTLFLNTLRLCPQQWVHYKTAHTDLGNGQNCVKNEHYSHVMLHICFLCVYKGLHKNSGNLMPKGATSKETVETRSYGEIFLWSNSPNFWVDPRMSPVQCEIHYFMQYLVIS
jgi:hypothetical protein